MFRTVFLHFILNTKNSKHFPSNFKWAFQHWVCTTEKSWNLVCVVQAKDTWKLNLPFKGDHSDFRSGQNKMNSTIGSLSEKNDNNSFPKLVKLTWALWTFKHSLSCVQIEWKRTRKRKFSLMFAVYSLLFFAGSLIFFTFAPTFAWCE